MKTILDIKMLGTATLSPKGRPSTQHKTGASTSYSEKEDARTVPLKENTTRKKDEKHRIIRSSRKTFFGNTVKTLAFLGKRPTVEISQKGKKDAQGKGARKHQEHYRIECQTHSLRKIATMSSSLGLRHARQNRKGGHLERKRKLRRKTKFSSARRLTLKEETKPLLLGRDPLQLVKGSYGKASHGGRRGIVSDGKHRKRGFHGSQKTPSTAPLVTAPIEPGRKKEKKKKS